MLDSHNVCLPPCRVTGFAAVLIHEMAATDLHMLYRAPVKANRGPVQTGPRSGLTGAQADPGPGQTVNNHDCSRNVGTP